jgi:hypothetical protein
MSKFPHETAVVVTVKIKDPDGNAYVEGVDPLGDKAGYILYQHDITGNDSQTALVNYVAQPMTKGTYYVDSSGTVFQKTTGYE